MGNKISNAVLDRVHAAYQREFEAWCSRRNNASALNPWQIVRLEPDQPIHESTQRIEKTCRDKATAEAWLATLRGRAAAQAALRAAR